MVSSARNPNESYAQRAKKASQSLSTPKTTQSTPAQSNPNRPSSLKPPPVNVWAERIKEQQAHAAPQPPQMPPPRATSSSQPPRDDPIPPRSPPPDLTAHLAILDQQDEHDPFIVRVPPHLSRQSSSSTNPLPQIDPATWPHLSTAEQHSNPSSTGRDSPFLSAEPSRQNSTASFRRHAYSPSGSVRLNRVPSSFSQHSQSASQSRTQSRSGSSASSPRLQIRGRTLPLDDPPPDLRLDPHRESSKKRSSPALPDPPNHLSPSLPQVDIVPPPSEPYYRRPSSHQDMPPRYLLSQFAFPPTHVAGHVSPPYIPPHSVQGTPPYPHYPPYPAYMYSHPSLFWGADTTRFLPHNHFQNQPSVTSNHANPSKHPPLQNTDLGSISPAVTTESVSSENRPQGQNGWQSKSSKNVIFGTINLVEGHDNPSAPSPDEEERTDPVVEQGTEQFAAFSIGVGPDEPGPSRLASRKSSVRSLSKILSPPPTSNDDTQDAQVAPEPQEVNGIKMSNKWEFGTTHCEDLDNPKPRPSESDVVSVLPSQESPCADRSMDRSEAGSSVSDVWVVKDYGFGFGDYSGSGYAPDVVRWEMQEREKERARNREAYSDRTWAPPRQPGWQQENGTEEDREGSEQHVQMDPPRYTRARRGSFPGYGGNERGGFTARRGRAFGGRFHSGRGRGFFHQRPASYPHVRPPPPAAPPPPAPFEVLPPQIVDMLNGYGQVAYLPPELETYEALLPPAQSRAPYTLSTYAMEAMKTCLLGQLEYYLSPQNMAQDYYLRQRMDSEGWIPISLLASFKRVQQLQTSVDMMREVLHQSASVEMNGDWVRMGARQWVKYVLPGASRSVVTRHDSHTGEGARVPPVAFDHNHDAEVDGAHGETEGDCDGEDCEAEDEEDEIEFVIGEEAEGSWMSVIPERKQ